MTDDATPREVGSTEGLGPLPEPPAFYRYQYQSHYGPVWRSSSENWNGCPPLASEGLYSADQMRAYAAQEVANSLRTLGACGLVDAQWWLLHRVQIVAAVEDAGFSIVSNAEGAVRLWPRSDLAKEWLALQAGSRA